MRRYEPGFNWGCLLLIVWSVAEVVGVVALLHWIFT